MSTNTAKVFFWSAARKRDEMLVLYDGKLSRTVLRRESGSDPADLAGAIFGGFAPNSQTADVLSKALGSYTVQSGSISRSKGENSQSLQMTERALMTPDELKSIPKGEFVVIKTGSHPMRTRLRLFLDWGITFGEPYQIPEHGQRKVYYARRQELEVAAVARYWTEPEAKEPAHPRQGRLAGQITGEHSHENVQGGKPMATMPKKPRSSDGVKQQRGVMFLAYYDPIYHDQELNHRAKAVYIYLKDHANKEGTCRPGINTIASGVSLSHSTVKCALDDLVRAGLVEKSSRWRENGSLSSNLYQVK